MSERVLIISSTVALEKSKLYEKYNTKSKKEIPLYLQMLCNGYLTIKKYCPKLEEVCLRCPNEGIEKRIERAVPANLRSNKEDKSYRVALEVLFQDALEECDLETLVDLLISASSLTAV